MAGFALALGSGGARGIAHSHILRAFDDLAIRPAVMSSASIGSLVGAAYAAGISGEEIQDIFLETFSDRDSVMSALWALRPKFWGGLPARDTGIAEFDIEKILAAFLPQSYPRNFDELKIPLKIVCTDFYGGRSHIIEKGDIRKAVAASASIPVLFLPVIIGDRVLMDGGITNPVPFNLFEGSGHKVVAVDVLGAPKGKPGSLPERLDSGFGATQIMMQSITNLQLQYMPPDLFLKPELGNFRMLDFLKVKDVLKTTEPIYDEARRGLELLLAQ